MDEFTPTYNTTAFDHGYAPRTIPAPCMRCVGGDMAATAPIDGLCHACRGEVQANRDDARDELVRTLYTGHGIGHGTYRLDVSR